ncbi:hypothetical protein [Evansella cellulosilytica]|uniref:HEAT repeat domain-containing protein n=1 Tax=Evansella cellulosilytica (strain ATCC 21833 / DSM 2522 / FERM P-1141 / JCM 9156 / N-4) TaxID=649639 RepID=E6TXK1_EVAC2|nr:hypothetical protein [Evansella cellulosilytica]ADU28815.1 hypothetical protein Bcell_0533 [Evansella cellulosilytica DSM 2522]
MDNGIVEYFEKLHAHDKQEQFEAFQYLLKAMEGEVDWSYEVWDRLKEEVESGNNHERSRAAQFLAALASWSDPEKRVLGDFPILWKVTYDEKFVTARHSLQSVWKVALAGNEQRELVLNHFIERFYTCEDERNNKLMRFDIIQGLKNIFDNTKEAAVKEAALKLIESENDEKYKKKYKNVWK